MAASQCHPPGRPICIGLRHRAECIPPNVTLPPALHHHHHCYLVPTRVEPLAWPRPGPRHSSGVTEKSPRHIPPCGATEHRIRASAPVSLR